MTQIIELFLSPGSCSLAPHIALEESGLPFVRHVVPIAERAHLAPDYLRVNSQGRLPALRMGNSVVTEAPAVLMTVAALAPRAGLEPRDSMLRGRMLEWLGFLSSSVHIAFAQLWRPERFLPASADALAFKAEALEIIARHFDQVERRLGEGPWALGTDYSLADPFLAVFWRWGRARLEWNMGGRFPRWTAHTTRMRSRPAVTRALAFESLDLQ